MQLLQLARADGSRACDITSGRYAGDFGFARKIALNRVVDAGAICTGRAFVLAAAASTSAATAVVHPDRRLQKRWLQRSDAVQPGLRVRVRVRVRVRMRVRVHRWNDARNTWKHATRNKGDGATT